MMDLFHPRFRLNGRPVDNPRRLVNALRPFFPDHADFVAHWLSDNPEIVLQTSGSTGMPKSISFPKEKLLQSARRTIDFFHLPPGSKVLINLQASYVAGKMMWVRALAGGWDVYVIPARRRLAVPDGIFFDFGAMVPYQAYHMPVIHKRFRQIILGGAPVAEDWIKDIQGSKAAVYLTYGMTETLTHVAVRPLNRPAMLHGNWNNTEHYHALPGVSFATYDGDLLQITDSVTGIGPLRTGDVVRLIDAERFRWLGRAGNVINSGGHKVIPEMVEQKLAPYIPVPFYLKGEPHPLLGEQVVMYLEGEAFPLDREEIFRRAELHPYERPKVLRFIPTFERTTSGKIIRK